MSKYGLLRLLDRFFQRWWVILLPVALLAALGVTAAAGSSSEYRAVGTINVASDTLLSSITSVGTVSFGFDSPAGATTSKLGELLSTGEFMKSVADIAGLKSAVETGTVTVDSLRSSISASPSGNNLVRITVVHENPEVAYRLATATVDAFKQWVVDSELSDSEVAQQVLSDRAAAHGQVLTEAQNALAAYQTEHPAMLNGVYAVEDQIEIDRLRVTVAAAQTRVDETASQLETTELAMQQAQTEIDQRLQLLDAPERPTSPEPRRAEMAKTFAMFVAIGALLSAAILVVSTAMDRTVRFAGEARDQLGLPILGAIPRTRK